MEGELVVLLLLSARCYVAVIFPSFSRCHGLVCGVSVHTCTHFFSADDIFRDIKFFVSDEKVR